MKLKGVAKRFWNEDQGQDLTEYALLLVLIALGAVLAMKALASALTNSFGSAATNLT